MNSDIYFRQFFSEGARERILKDVADILESGRLMKGPYSEKLEAHIADHLGVSQAASVNSCTTALTICLKHFGAEGYEVLVPAATFVTCVSSIMFAGGLPVLVDVNPRTLSFDLNDLERKLTNRTRGILWVHLTGLISPEYADIVSFCKKHGLFLIEDCAQAHGATIDGRLAGTMGDAACFSFYATKIVTAGNGGVIASSDTDLIEYARRMRLFGKDANSGDITDFGNDWFLDELRASVAYNHYLDVETNLAERRGISRQYVHFLGNQPGISFLDYGVNAEPAFYQFCVLLDPELSRDEVIKVLKEDHGVAAAQIYPPIHHEKIFRHLDSGDLTGAEEAMRRALCLPLHHFMTETDVEHAASALVEVVGRLRD